MKAKPVVLTGLAVLLLLGVLVAFQQGEISIRDQKNNWSADYSFTLQGACLPNGQLTVEVPDAMHIVTYRQLNVFFWHLPIGHFYSIAGNARANGQVYDFAESDHGANKSLHATHQTNRVLSGNGQLIQQSFKIDGNQKVAIAPATC